MGVQKTTHVEGTGQQPVHGQKVFIEYTGWLKDDSKPDAKGEEFDSTSGRGDFVTEIGVGKLIRGMFILSPFGLFFPHSLECFLFTPALFTLISSCCLAPFSSLRSC